MQRQRSPGRSTWIVISLSINSRRELDLLVVLVFQATVFDNRSVVGPSLIGQVDFLLREETGHEGETNTKRTGTRDRLGGGDAALLERLGVFTVCELDGGVDEFRETGDGEVFLVVAGLGELLFGFLLEEWSVNESMNGVRFNVTILAVAVSPCQDRGMKH